MLLTLLRNSAWFHSTSCLILRYENILWAFEMIVCFPFSFSTLFFWLRVQEVPRKKCQWKGWPTVWKGFAKSAWKANCCLSVNWKWVTHLCKLPNVLPCIVTGVTYTLPLLLMTVCTHYRLCILLEAAFRSWLAISWSHTFLLRNEKAVSNILQELERELHIKHGTQIIGST